jgi:hypothetical protein
MPGTRRLALLVAGAALLAAPGAAHGTIVTNGDFETGTLSGWQVDDFLPGSGSWYAYTGTTAPGGATVSAPPQGTYAAVTSQSDPGRHIMYQDVTLPPGGSVNKLSLFVYYTTGAAMSDSDTLDPAVIPNEQYRIDVMKPTAPLDSLVPDDILLTVFSTSSADASTLAPIQKGADLTAFAGQTVRLRFAEVDNQAPLHASADAVSVRSNGFVIGAAVLNKKKGTAKIPVTVPDAGTLTVSGDGVKGRITAASNSAPVSTGTVTVLVKTKGKKRRKLNKLGKVKVAVKLTYTPDGVKSNSEKANLKLKKKKKR